MQRKILISARRALAGYTAACFILSFSTMALAQKRAAVLQFNGTNGKEPYSTLLADSSGNLYGTTYAGGGGVNLGTVYKLTPPTSGTKWTETVLYAFTGVSDGGVPVGGLSIDSAGNLYGTTTTGGSKRAGTVFQLSPPASGSTWTFTVVYNLTASNNGYPIYPVVDKFGNVYFIEPEGGANGPGQGVVSELSPPATSGGTWTYKKLYDFQGMPSDGSLPIGTLTLDKSGNLYGATANGGNEECFGYGCGTVFELVRPATRSGKWTENIVYVFQNLPDAAHPYSGVIFDGAGNLYGTTQQGGIYGSTYGGFGTVYELSPISGGGWTESLLYSFANLTDGGGPRAALVMDKHGNLYGTTITPTAFELSPPAEAGGAWTETTLDSFTSGGKGAGQVYAGLTFRLPGTVTLYGATLGGGSANDGVVYSVVS
jgi:uncharacterized repeat protein (TIGR03803 family)